MDLSSKRQVMDIIGFITNDQLNNKTNTNKTEDFDKNR